MNAARVKAELLAVRARVDHLLEELDKGDSAGGAPSPWMSVSQYARHKGVSGDTVRRWIREGMPAEGTVKGNDGSVTGVPKLTRVHRDLADEWRRSR